MNEYIEQKKKEYEKLIDYKQNEDGSMEFFMLPKGHWDFIEQTIKETLLMAKEKTMLEKRTRGIIISKGRDPAGEYLKGTFRTKGYNKAISDTEEKWKQEFNI